MTDQERANSAHFTTPDGFAALCDKIVAALEATPTRSLTVVELVPLVHANAYYVKNALSSLRDQRRVLSQFDRWWFVRKDGA